MKPSENKLRKIIRKTISEFLDNEITESKVSRSDLSKAFDTISKISLEMLANLEKYKAAVAKGTSVGKGASNIEKYRKIAGDLTKKRKSAEANMERLLLQLDKDAELQINAGQGQDPLGLNTHPSYKDGTLSNDALGTSESRSGGKDASTKMDSRVNRAYTDLFNKYFDMFELSKRYLVDDKDYKKRVSTVGVELLKLSKYLRSQKYI